MLLMDEEKAMLDGQQGAGVQKAMDLLVNLGDCFGAEKWLELTGLTLCLMSYHMTFSPL